MTSPWVARPMARGDIPAVVKVEQEIPSPWSREQLLEEFARPGGWQYVGLHAVTGEIAGYICGMTVTGEAEIFRVAVAREHHRQRVGSTLLDTALQHLREMPVSSCFLELRASNVPARKLYERFGFIETGVRKKYYRNPEEHAIIMVRRFP